jgi:hypothetical protein
MTATPTKTVPDSTWCSARRYLERIRDWPENGNSSYSPFFCVSLLLSIALIIEIGR